MGPQSSSSTHVFSLLERRCVSFLYNHLTNEKYNLFKYGYIYSLFHSIFSKCAFNVFANIFIYFLDVNWLPTIQFVQHHFLINTKHLFSGLVDLLALLVEEWRKKRGRETQKRNQTKQKREKATTFHRGDDDDNDDYDFCLVLSRSDLYRQRCWFWQFKPRGSFLQSSTSTAKTTITTRPGRRAKRCTDELNLTGTTTMINEIFDDFSKINKSAYNYSERQLWWKRSRKC